MYFVNYLLWNGEPLSVLYVPTIPNIANFPASFGITAPADVLYMYYLYYRAILNDHPPLQ